MGNQLQRLKDMEKEEEGLLGDRVHTRKGRGERTCGYVCVCFSSGGYVLESSYLH